MYDRMRLFGITFLLSMTLGSGAFAADDGLLRVGVAPFSGQGSGGTPMAEAIELELELVETVLVKGGRWMKRDIRRAGASAFEPKSLQALMRKRKLDVVVHGLVQNGELWVSAYDEGGVPRFRENFALPKDVDARASEIVSALRPAFADWDSLTAKSGSASREREGGGLPEGDDGGLFVGGAEPLEKSTTPAKTKPERRRPASRESREAEQKRPRRMLDGNESENDDRPQNSWMDDLPSKGSDEPSIFDRPKRRKKPVFDRADKTLEDLEENNTEQAKSRHWLALSLGFDANLWNYAFTGKIPEQSISHPSSSDSKAGYTNAGGNVHASYWGTENFGVDADARLVYMGLNAAGIPITPQSITALTYQFGLIGRARYLWDFEPWTIGVGARLGYRLWGRGISEQTSSADGESRTVFPGWRQNGLVLGADFFATAMAWQRRFEFEARFESIPLAHYMEIPDNPGGSSRALSWNLGALVRIPVVDPVHVELGFYSMNSSVFFAGLGDRLTRDRDGTPVTLQGGDVSNSELGLSLAVGVAF